MHDPGSLTTEQSTLDSSKHSIINWAKNVLGINTENIAELATRLGTNADELFWYIGQVLDGKLALSREHVLHGVTREQLTSLYYIVLGYNTAAALYNAAVSYTEEL